MSTMQNTCADIKVRAERRIGEMLRADPDIGPGKGSTLEPLGIEKLQSHRWQAIASIRRAGGRSSGELHSSERTGQVIVPPLWTPGQRRLPLLPPLPSERERWRRLWREPFIQQAAVTMTALTSGGSDVDASSWTTASVTPGANRLVIAVLAVTHGPGAGGLSYTAAGNGLTWVELGRVNYGTIAAPARALWVFRSMGASPTAGAITFTEGAASVSLRAAWSVMEFAGVDTGGTNGSAAVRSPTTGNVDAATSLSITLPAFASVNNGTFGAFSHTTQEASTAGTGFTAIHDVSPPVEALRVFTEWRADNDTGVDYSSASALDRGGVAFEIVAAATANPFGRWWWW